MSLGQTPLVMGIANAIAQMEGFNTSTQRIGVYDYASCVACLRTNFFMVFGYLSDPQDMIQKLAAEIQNLRRKEQS